MTTEKIENAIKESLDDFYKRRLAALRKLTPKQTFSRKNPYLYRALGIEKVSELVEEILRAHISSSDETIFGDAFFEPIAKLCSGAKVSDAEDVDITIETENVYKAISVKSGPHVFNAAAKKKQDQAFKALKSRLQKLQKQFDPILGHGYGRISNQQNPQYIYRNLAGQAFWEELTEDPEFYIKIIRIMSEPSYARRIEYESEFSKAVNRFTKAFLSNFDTGDGGIDWEKWLTFNSGKFKSEWKDHIDVSEEID
jgi:hypothetical protein